MMFLQYAKSLTSTSQDTPIGPIGKLANTIEVSMMGGEMNPEITPSRTLPAISNLMQYRVSRVPSTQIFRCEYVNIDDMLSLHLTFWLHCPQEMQAPNESACHVIHYRAQELSKRVCNILDDVEQLTSRHRRPRPSP